MAPSEGVRRSAIGIIMVHTGNLCPILIPARFSTDGVLRRQSGTGRIL